MTESRRTYWLRGFNGQSDFDAIQNAHSAGRLHPTKESAEAEFPGVALSLLEVTVIDHTAGQPMWAVRWESNRGWHVRRAWYPSGPAARLLANPARWRFRARVFASSAEEAKDQAIEVWANAGFAHAPKEAK